MIETSMQHSHTHQTYTYTSLEKNTYITHQQGKQSGGVSSLLQVQENVNISYSSSSLELYSNNQINSAAEKGYDLLRSMVLGVFEKQSVDYTVDTGEKVVDISTLTQEDAKQLIASDGYFGVEKTAERIFNFAVGIAGNDSNRIDAIKQGIEQGFQEALEAFGGWLPDISYNTFDTVMTKLDDWVQSSHNPSSKIEVL